MARDDDEEKNANSTAGWAFQFYSAPEEMDINAY